MKKFAILAILIIAFSISIFAEGDPPCVDGHTPAGISCRNQNVPANTGTETQEEKPDDIFTIVNNWFRAIW